MVGGMAKSVRSCVETPLIAFLLQDAVVDQHPEDLFDVEGVSLGRLDDPPAHTFGQPCGFADEIVDQLVRRRRARAARRTSSWNRFPTSVGYRGDPCATDRGSASERPERIRRGTRSDRASSSRPNGCRRGSRTTCLVGRALRATCVPPRTSPVCPGVASERPISCGDAFLHQLRFLALGKELRDLLRRLRSRIRLGDPAHVLDRFRDRPVGDPLAVREASPLKDA